MSRDEDLIAHGWPEDVWFHVDNLSSAHVYLRLPDPANAPWTAIPKDLLTDCAQLTKANSIEGNKKDNVTVIYTPWSNLKKTGDMATGQVGFKDNKLVKKVHVEQRENGIVNRLNKTRVEKFPDLRAEKADKEREERKKERMAAQIQVCRSMEVRRARTDLSPSRRRKMPKWRRNGWRSSGRRRTCTMTCTMMTICRSRAIRIGMPTGRMILCRHRCKTRKPTRLIPSALDCNCTPAQRPTLL